MKRREFRFWDYIALFVKWRKLIVLNFIILCTLAAILSFLLPKWYRAETTLMPPADQSIGALGLTSMLGDLPLGEFGLPGMTGQTEIFKAILESRTVARAVIETHDLMEVYRKDNLEFAIQTLYDHTSIDITEEGLIEISVEERSPELAAAIANSFVDELDRVNQLSSMSQAKNTRLFIEGRLEESKRGLKAAEEALRGFQEKHKTVALTEQLVSMIEGAAELKAEQVLLEVEKGVLTRTFSASHPQVLRLEIQIEEIQKQLDQIVIGEPDSAEGETPRGRGSENEFTIPLSEAPALGLQLARLMREVKIQETVFELLTQQYEQSKIQEAKDTPTVQVLDRAQPPKLRSRPVRRHVVLFAGGLSIFMSLLCIAWVEYLRGLRERQEEDYRRIRSLASELRSDATFILRKIGLRKRTGSNSNR